MDAEIPRLEFIEVVSKVASSASDAEILAGCETLTTNERKLVEGMLLMRAGEEAQGLEVFGELSTCNTPAIAKLAQLYLQPPQEPPPPKMYVPKSSLDEVIGYLRWRLAEAPDFKVVEEGELYVKLSDIFFQVIDGSADPLISKNIKVGENVTFSLNSGLLQGEEFSGFGFTGRHAQQESFSWEWYHVDAPDHATKLQETGEVTFQTKRTPDGLDIISTKFIKPISVRISRMGLDSPLEPHWRFDIAQNSEITWPSLINGQVVPNSRN